MEWIGEPAVLFSSEGNLIYGTCKLQRAPSGENFCSRVGTTLSETLSQRRVSIAHGLTERVPVGWCLLSTLSGGHSHNETYKHFGSDVLPLARQGGCAHKHAMEHNKCNES